jgi:hypothetical protein
MTSREGVKQGERNVCCRGAGVALNTFRKVGNFLCICKAPALLGV